jgi:photosystem II stability/assembly factor-like uncharacterized protein
MKWGWPLLLVLCLAACGRFQINIEVSPKPTLTLSPQATFTAERIPASPLPPTPSQTPAATPTPVPATPTRTPAPADTASPAPSLMPTLAPLPVNSDDPAFPALPPLEAGQVITLTTIQMMDETMGWGLEIGGHILRTRDGGLTWKSVTPPRGRYQPGGLFALDGEIAWASPYNLDATCTWTPAGCPEELPPVRTAFVWRTDDGGSTWRPSHPFSLGDRDGDTRSVLFYNPVALHFLDAQTGWLLVTVNHLMNQDFYRLYQTVDGGDTWNRLADNQFGPPFCTVYGLGFRDALTGWIGGSCVGLGLADEAHWGVYQTADGGQSWNWATLPPPANLPGGFSQYVYECGVETIDLIPPAAVGVEMACALRDKTSGYSAYRFYYLSPDGGSNWRDWQMTGAVDFLNHDSGWRQSANAVGGYDLEHSQDGGQTWALVKTVYWQGQLDFVSEQVGWAIARLGEATALLKTSDGGQSWAEIKPVAGP